MPLTPEHKSISQKKRTAQFNSIPTEWRLPKDFPQKWINSNDAIASSGILSAAELSITSITSARVLRDKMLSKELTCKQVTTAFCKRAAVAQQLIGCCTEMIFDRALERAKELDEYLEREGKPWGLLHGVPVSVKDSFDIKGVDSTIGWLGLIGKPAKENMPAIDMLLEMGAVLYVKSNIPQSLMMSDSYNHVFGQSVNALNKNLISGGSSGGEGALVGAHASIIGIGTDIGGSIRIPAELQGLYGLMPSVGRTPYESSAKEQEFIVLPTAGPLTTDIESIELYMHALTSVQPWEKHPRLLPIPWREDLARVPEGKLKVAFIEDDGIVRPQPPVARAVKEMKERFQKAGHEVIEWDLSAHAEGTKLWDKAVKADGGLKCRNYCDLIGEPLIEGMVVGKPEDELSAVQRQELGEIKLEFEKAHLKRWNQSGIDGLIMPVMPWVNYPPKAWVKSNQWLGYSALWNFLNYASLVVPVTKVDPRIDTLETSGWSSHQPRNESDEFNHQQYNPELVKDMPVGLQIITGRFGEEKAVGIAKLIETFK